MKNDQREIAVKVSKVSKKYLIHHEKPTLAEGLVKRRYKAFWALKDINLTISKKEKVGIIGPNGSGKTTLLKIIAGIASPTKGNIETYGEIVTLIDLEAGFHPDLTGEQNIFLSGMLLGIRKEEIASELYSIKKFADIGDFINAPLFTYSEGMKLRLGFSIAVHANPDILILDEGISIGDKDFQKKSQDKIQEFFKLGKTILVATHGLEFIKRNCNRIIVMDKGRIAQDGPARLVDNYVLGIKKREI